MLPSLAAACVSADTGGPPPSNPTITGVTNDEERATACGISWRRTVTWSLSAIDDVNYTISVTFVGGADIATGLLPSAGAYSPIDTGVTAAAGTGFFHSTQYTVKLVRVSDSSVVSQMNTALVTIETGAFC